MRFPLETKSVGGVCGAAHLEMAIIPTIKSCYYLMGSVEWLLVRR